MKLNVPFIKGRNFECGQTCTAMMIKYFKPDFEPNFDTFNKVIHRKENIATFPSQNAILLDYFGIKSMSFSSDTISLTKEDPEQFKRWFGKDYEYAMKSIDVESFDWMVKEIRKKNLFMQKVTEFEELLKLFNKGYLVCIPINWNVLNNKTGPYVGHFVVISGVDGDKIFVHDPDIGPFIEYSIGRIKGAWDLPPVTDDYFVAYGEK